LRAIPMVDTRVTIKLSRNRKRSGMRDPVPTPLASWQKGQRTGIFRTI